METLEELTTKARYWDEARHIIPQPSVPRLYSEDLGMLRDAVLERDHLKGEKFRFQNSLQIKAPEIWKTQFYIRCTDDKCWWIDCIYDNFEAAEERVQRIISCYNGKTKVEILQVTAIATPLTETRGEVK